MHLVFKKILQPFRWYFSLSFLGKLKYTIVVFLTSTFIGSLALFLMYLSIVNGVFGEVPTERELENISNAEASEVYSSDGVLLGRYYIENRTDAKYDEISPIIINALIATEDSRFYEHKGIDHWSMFRVLFKSILLGQNKGGGSTLSQQLAKNLFGRKDYGILTMPVNKMREAIIANRMEHVYSKQEILTLYLNTVSFGEDTYGISLACERFFSTSTQNIKPEEASVLIGMLKSPTLYNPRTNPKNAINRRNVVIHQLYKNDYITEKEKQFLLLKPLKIKYKRLSHKDGKATHFREYLRKHLENWLRENSKSDGSYYNLYTDGLRIQTTINSKLQQYATEAVKERITELQPVLNKDIARTNVFSKNSKKIEQIMHSTARYKKMLKEGYTKKEVSALMLEPVKMNLISISGEVDTLLSPIDSIKYHLIQLQAGFLALDAKTGKILSWVGGVSFQQNQYDHILSKRQVGSIFKPIVYAQSLRSGKEPCDYISNQSVTYTSYDNWSPQNSGAEKVDGKYSVAGALANSVNTVSVKLCMDAGIKNVIDLAMQLGINEEFPEVPSIALGTIETSLLKMVGAYTAFTNQGVYSKPQFIEEIIDNNGNLIFKSKLEQNQVIEESVAENIINMMQGVVDAGTAIRLRTRYKVNGSVAGKTGTTQDQRDGWFVGCTPNWIAGSWVGADYPFVHFSSIINGQGANTALPIWAKFYKKIEQDEELKKLVRDKFQFKNDIDCEPFKEDNLLNKIFKSKKKKDKRKGLKKKKKGWFTKR